MTEIALVFLVNIVSSFLKGFVYPRFGKVGVQVMVFMAALLGAIYYTYASNFGGLKELIESAIALFSLAVALYEVLLSKFSLFREGLPQDQDGV